MEKTNEEKEMYFEDLPDTSFQEMKAKNYEKSKDLAKIEELLLKWLESKSLTNSAIVLCAYSMNDDAEITDSSLMAIGRKIPVEMALTFLSKKVAQEHGEQ